jgi:hypothetical protein
MKQRLHILSAILAAPLLLATGTASADPGLQIPGVMNQSVIGANVLSGIRGRAAVNMAAGEENIQSNAAALAAGAAGSAMIGIVQNANANGQNGASISTASIGPGAFSNASGLLSINQTSGVANAQANTAALGVGAGVEVVADSTLATTISNAGPAVAGTGNKTRLQGVSISDTAFQGARGLVQVNQSAGSGNATANNFALHVEMGAKP